MRRATFIVAVKLRNRMENLVLCWARALGDQDGKTIPRGNKSRRAASVRYPPGLSSSYRRTFIIK
ncbi:hypothetical protein KCP78_20020 [Salmonella enterica subsp. enterica]|nr:hypothetical protein KCP78_20020 [Salmonella enterica subsp. enterica]